MGGLREFLIQLNKPVREWKWNHKVEHNITVNGILDLNLLPGANIEGQFY